jgi:hypothetical protein
MGNAYLRKFNLKIHETTNLPDWQAGAQIEFSTELPVKAAFVYILLHEFARIL